MPELDVSDVLLDATIAGEEFIAIRRQEIVNRYGESVLALQPRKARGAITPIGLNSLLREEAFQTGENTIQVVTSFPLRMAGKDPAGLSFQPDLVLHDGNYFVVRQMNDYTRYGAGVLVAECSSITRLDQAPGFDPATLNAIAARAPSLDFSDPQNTMYLPLGIP